MLTAALIMGVLWGAVPTVNAFHNVTVQAQDTTDIIYNGTWANQEAYCTATRFTSTIGSSFSLTFFGVAIYVIGTVDCDWSGLMSIVLDGSQTQFDRRACPQVVGSSSCEYPWLTAEQLSNTTHTVTVTLIGPPVAQAPAHHIISDFRYAIYSQLDPGDSLWPVTTPSQTSNPPSPSSSSSGGSTAHTSSTGPIVGGVIGVIAALLIIGFLVFWFCFRRRKNQEDEQPDLVGGQLTYGTGLAPTPWIDPASVPMLHHSSTSAAAFISGTPMAQASKEDLTRTSGTTPSTGLTTSDYQQQQQQTFNPYAVSSSSGEWNPYSVLSEGSRPQVPLYAQGITLIPPRDHEVGRHKSTQGVAPPPSTSPAHSTDPSAGGDAEHEMVNRIAATVAAMMRGEIGPDGARLPPPQYDPRS